MANVGRSLAKVAERLNIGRNSLSRVKSGQNLAKFGRTWPHWAKVRLCLATFGIWTKSADVDHRCRCWGSCAGFGAGSPDVLVDLPERGAAAFRPKPCERPPLWTSGRRSRTLRARERADPPLTHRGDPLHAPHPGTPATARPRSHPQRGRRGPGGWRNGPTAPSSRVSGNSRAHTGRGRRASGAPRARPSLSAQDGATARAAHTHTHTHHTRTRTRTSPQACSHAHPHA